MDRVGRLGMFLACVVCLTNAVTFGCASEPDAAGEAVGAANGGSSAAVGGSGAAGAGATAGGAGVAGGTNTGAGGTSVAGSGGTAGTFMDADGGDGSCTVDGVRYENGAAISSDNDCHSCICDNGKVSCTLDNCAPTCVVARHLDSCFFGPEPVTTAMLADNPCLRAYGDGDIPGEIPAQCRKQWDPACATLTTFPMEPPSRLAAPNADGVCSYIDECDTADDCVLVQDESQCCSPVLSIPVAIRQNNVCWVARDSQSIETKILPPPACTVCSAPGVCPNQTQPTKPSCVFRDDVGFKICD